MQLQYIINEQQGKVGILTKATLLSNNPTMAEYQDELIDRVHPFLTAGGDDECVTPGNIQLFDAQGQIIDFADEGFGLLDLTTLPQEVVKVVIQNRQGGDRIVEFDFNKKMVHYFKDCKFIKINQKDKFLH